MNRKFLKIFFAFAEVMTWFTWMNGAWHWVLYTIFSKSNEEFSLPLFSLLVSLFPSILNVVRILYCLIKAINSLSTKEVLVVTMKIGCCFFGKFSTIVRIEFFSRRGSHQKNFTFSMEMERVFIKSRLSFITEGGIFWSRLCISQYRHRKLQSYVRI